MTTSPEPEGRERRMRRFNPRMLIIGGIGAAVLCAVVWQSVVARQQVRIPLAGELSQQPETDLLASLKAHGIDGVVVEDGCLVVSAADESRCRQFLQESSADQTTW